MIIVQSIVRARIESIESDLREQQYGLARTRAPNQGSGQNIEKVAREKFRADFAAPKSRPAKI